MEQRLLSVIIPSYNVSSKLNACLDSLDKLSTKVPSLEVIFVDDCSTDDTYTRIVEFCENRPWAVHYQLESNSGTPSTPRNHGLAVAKGKYVFFLDPDDEILAAGVQKEIEIAETTSADLVRAPLLRFDGKSTTKTNTIADWEEITSHLNKVKAIVRYHSTTVCALYRRSFLSSNSINWPMDLRLAEDAVFLYRALVCANIEYSDEPDFKYNVTVVEGEASSTQQYQARELENHLRAWERCAEILKPLGIDYFFLRGQISIQAAFQNMIRFNRGGFTREEFKKLRDFLLENRRAVENFTFGPRFTELCDLLLADKYEMFLEAIKIRLLIAGYDLRFIMPAVPELSRHYQIRVDEWTGHETHDLAKSERLLNWADSIHCEWMLGNAVWYSKNKRPGQSLVVRLHRFETSKNYGFEIDQSNLDAIITIAPGMFDEMQEVFNFPRELVTYIPNYIETDKYQKSEDPDKVFNLVMVGSIPIRKGYMRALQLLKQLHDIDSRYSLTVYGRRPDELGWVFNDPKEREYFSLCDQYIRQNGLESRVRFEGWVDTLTELADKGFVLSMSDAEGSHVAAAEGFAAGNITLLRPWEGAEFMYPNQYIFDSIESMRDYVLSCRDFETFVENAKAGAEYVESRYSMNRFFDLYTTKVPVPHRVP